MSVSKRSICFWLVLLALLGTWWYARRNPVFAEQCRTFYTLYVKPAADAGKALLRKQTEAVENQAGRASGSRFDRRGQTGEDVYRETLDGNANVPAQSTTGSLSPGMQIANGHAYGKHRHEFGFASREEMAAHIDRVVTSTGPPNVKRLEHGRAAYWDTATASVVITDPNTSDGGTAFKPGRGRAYFTNLR